MFCPGINRAPPHPPRPPGAVIHAGPCTDGVGSLGAETHRAPHSDEASRLHSSGAHDSFVRGPSSGTAIDQARHPCRAASPRPYPRRSLQVVGCHSKCNEVGGIASSLVRVNHRTSDSRFPAFHDFLPALPAATHEANSSASFTEACGTPQVRPGCIYDGKRIFPESEGVRSTWRYNITGHSRLFLRWSFAAIGALSE